MELYVQNAATSPDVELVFSMAGSTTPGEKIIFTVAKHAWVIVMIQIDGRDVIMSVKDDPSDYEAQSANEITNTNYLGKLYLVSSHSNIF